ncbi:MAG: hypothetical protein HRU75_05120 [Planctomycetia bacterium]|nr:MAG: hypothetical protein HRU75_05120 [Planctomycetia bacterium]
MSAIPPPNWLTSVLGSPAAAKRAAEERQRGEVSEAERVDPAAFARKLEGAVSNDGADGSVYADAEGSGGQGRSSGRGESHDEPADDEPPKEPDGGTVGGNLDVSA